MKLLDRAFQHIKDGTFLSSIASRIVGEPFSLSEKNVMKKQQMLLTHVLSEASQHCRYYKELFSSHKCTDILKYPILSKAEIQKDFESFCSDRKNRVEYHEAFTGGSTGEPFRFLLSGGYEKAFGLRKWKEYGFQKNDLIIAMDGTCFEEDEIKSGKYIKQVSDTDIPFGSHAMSSLYLTNDNASEYCRTINKYRPAFLRGYPAFIYSIASYAEALDIKMDGFLKGVELTSETAAPYQIEKIRAIFNAPVFLQYGHSEACVFAYTIDEQYKYRVEPLYGYVEVLDDNGNHVKENEVGEVVVTSLHNYAMPLIRYKTGDYAEYGGKDDRYMYLNRVLGRTQDYIYTSRGDKKLLTALIFGQHCPAMGRIRKWIIEQFQPGEILVHIEKAEGYCKRDEIDLLTLFSSLGDVTVSFHYTSNIPLTPRGKSKMIIQHVSL